MGFSCWLLLSLGGLVIYSYYSAAATAATAALEPAATALKDIGSMESLWHFFGIPVRFLWVSQ